MYRCKFRWPLGLGTRMKDRIVRPTQVSSEALADLRLVSLLLGIFLLLQIAATAQTKPIRRILILNEAGISHPGINIIDKGIRTGLQSAPYHLELYTEYLDTILFPDAADQQRIRGFLIGKYKNRQPDVIITVGPGPLKFMNQVHQTAFPGIPIVFCLPNEVSPGSPALDSYFAGVENNMKPAETLKAALGLQPDTRHVVVLGGTADFDQQQVALVRERLKVYENQLDISYLTNFAMPDLLERLRRLPAHTVILYTAIGKDATGTKFISGSESAPMVAAAANAPIFTLYDVYLNHGEVGGDLSSLDEQGKLAGTMALRILKGERPQDIARARDVTAYMFDWRALKRWGFNEKKLPQGSIVVNRQPTVWAAYKWYITIGVSLIVLQALLIGKLVWQRTALKRSEQYTREVVLRSPIAKVVTRGDRNDLINDKFTDLFGYTIDDVPGVEQWWPLAYPDEQYRREIKAEWESRVEKALELHKSIEPMEAKVCCKNGTIRHIEFHFASLGDASIVSFVDITERQLAQTRLREGEERFRHVANSAPVLIWMAGPDQLCTYVNQQWLKFTGRTEEEETGNGWADGIHTDDSEKALATYTEAFRQRQPFTMEYRLRRYDDEYRWVLDTGAPIINPDGSFSGYIGSAIDVTERKLAEEALASIGGKLIAAQEAERTRIARELHDDVNQQLAFLAISLDQMRKGPPRSVSEIRSRTEALFRKTEEISRSLQALSHQLHSSKLEYFGLVNAMQGFCREFSDQHHVEVQFLPEYVPQHVPKEISLCLFRVMQAGLTNALKHSGVNRFEVGLHGTTYGVHLTVHDDGVGFDPDTALRSEGIGIISMRERVRFVNGTLAIDSKANGGTTITVDVPLSSVLSHLQSA
ncbi:MAG: hypothetical protein DMG60_06700 [Acidobacteria bacterium]|nr:MAG: hypothetical protein DMG60_06700 [Acidobacteriota bacterium]